MSRKDALTPVDFGKIGRQTQRWQPTASQLPYGTRGLFLSAAMLPRYIPASPVGLPYRIKLETQPQRRAPNRIKGYGTKY